MVKKTVQKETEAAECEGAMVCSTIRDILVQAEKKFGAEDAIRYKGHKKEIITKSYTQLKEDSAAF